VVSVDVEAAIAEPQVAQTAQQIQQMIAMQSPGAQGVPAVGDLTSFAFGVRFSQATPDEPNVFLAVSTSKDFSMVQSNVASMQLTTQEVDGKTYYTKEGMAMTISPNNDTLLIANSVSDVQSMVTSFNSNNIATRNDV